MDRESIAYRVPIYGVHVYSAMVDHRNAKCGKRDSGCEVLLPWGVNALRSAALCLAISSTAFAQRATGLLRDSATSGVIGGAVVSALDSARHTLARTISSDSGRYSIAISERARLLRVVRLGFQPRELPLPVDREPQLALDVRMTRVATLLAASVVSDDQLCSSDIDRTGALSLWEQARAGLLATVVAREALPADASILSYQRLIDDASTRVVHHDGRIVRGRTTRPFQAGVAPLLLAVFGYIDIDSIGQPVFRAPDADVLLDDSFASTHCFNVKHADAQHPGMIGLAFEPAGGRKTLVDVAGTLWMAAGTPALRTIEFLYTDADGELARIGSGGTLSFHEMPNGVSFIKEWVIRLPVIDSSSKAGTLAENRIGVMGQRRLPLQTSEAGGIVMSATWPDSSTFTAPLKAFVGHVVEQKTTTPMRDIRVAFEAFRDTLTSDSLGRVSMFPMLPGRYRVAAIDTTLGSFIDARIAEKEFVVARESEMDVHLELPGLNDLVATICEGLDVPRNSVALLGRIGDGYRPVPLPRNVSIVASWKTGRLLSGSRSVMVDASGRFAVCGVPHVNQVKLTASRFGYDFADVVVPMETESLLEEFYWTLDIGAMTRLSGQKLASVSGRITEDGGNRIVGAEVWIPTVDRHATTDSLGEFRVDSIPLGPTLVQVRRLGYAPARDRVLLAAGQVRRRDFVLERETMMLEGMTVTAASLAGKSSGYRGFESRRIKKTGGYFVSDSTIRALGDRTLGNILLSRVSGATSVPGTSGQTFLVSSSRTCSGGVNSCRMPSCYVTIFMDGRAIYPLSLGDALPAPNTKSNPYQITAFSGGEPPPDINFFQTASLSGIEFYPSSQPVPPEFSRRNSQCGTLLLWTRER